MGKRLGELTRNNTKCMVKVNGVTLIERLLHQLEDVAKTRGLSKVVLVIGYEGQKLRDYIDSLNISVPIEFVENPIYATTNNIYSLYLAKDYLVQDDTLLFESDLIFEDSVISCLLDNPYPSLALVAKFESWMDGTVVTLDEDDNILRFIPGKKFSYRHTEEYYKTVNIYKFSKEFSASHYVPFLKAYSAALGNNEYYEQVLRVITLLDKPEIKALRLGKESWYEIDDVQDLDIAESIFCPTEEKMRKIGSRFGGYWRYPQILDFCYLVNPYFPNARMRSELKANFDRLLGDYPSGMRVNSLLAGKYFGIKADYVCVGNGAAELIKSLCSAMDGKVGVIYPTFEEYPHRLCEENLVPYIAPMPDFRYTAQDLMDFYADKQLSHLLIINPDNPSGNFISKEDVLKLSLWCAEKNVRLVIDESFVDFSEDGYRNTLLTDDILEAHPHLIVVKSISKSYGVPGLRLGVLATSDSAFITSMKKDVAIWNINSFAEFYMQIFGKYESQYHEACAEFRAERERFIQELRVIPFLRVIPSQANYFMCEVLPPYTAKQLVGELLEKFNIFVKDCSNKRPLQQGHYIRIAVRDTQDNNALINALHSFY